MKKGKQVLIPTGPIVPTDPMARGPLPVKSDIEPWPDQLVMRHAKPETIDLLVGLYISFGCDMASALAHIKPGFQPLQYISYANHLMQQEHIVTGIRARMEAIGCGEDAQKKFIGMLWENAMDRGADKTIKIAAMKLLGQAMGLGEIADEDKKIKSLPIKDFKTGIDAMMSDEAAQSGSVDSFTVPISPTKPAEA